VLPWRNPYWQFREIAELEEALGVRSAFYILNEPHILSKDPGTWVRPQDWVQHLGRYDINDPDLRAEIRRLQDNGWEIGIHGSYRSSRDPVRLRYEKDLLENLLAAPVAGGRQHYLNVSIPETWRYHADIGLRYDASLGSSETYGFQYGYSPIRPFDDEFVVFPLTVIESALPYPSSCYD
jgi:hypothetical protein